MGSNPKLPDATQNIGSFATDASPAAKVELGPGVTLNERYLIDKELGRGGMGVVYLARDERLHGMPVVIKFLLDDSDQNAWQKKKFFQEAEALSRLNHPGIVRVIDRDQAADGTPFFVMEYVKGKALRSVMQTDGMDLEHAAHLIRQIGQALKAAHNEGIFHRDLKPENIMLQALTYGDEQVKLIDFGIAKVKNSQTGATTEVAIVAGSLSYMAPEQLLSQAVTSATDLYAFAIIAYEMVTGRRPFNPDAPTMVASAQQLIGMQQREDAVPPKRLRPSLPDEAQQVILKALSFDPASRPQDARAFGEELANALLGATQSVSPSTWQGAVTKTQQVLEQPTLRVGAADTEPIARQVTANVTAAPVYAPATAATIADERPTANRRRWILVALLLVAAVVAAILFGTRLLSSRNATTAPPATATAPVANNPTGESERQLTYAITVQKDPKRYPGSKPFQLPGEVIFSAGDRVRFTFTSGQSGYLYILNESPEGNGGQTIFNVLFPSSTSNNSSAQLGANQAVQIPERGDGFIFDAEEGTEKLWLVWSATAIADLEALKRWANAEDRGEIKDATQANALRDFLVKNSASRPEVEKDDVKKQTTVRGKGEMLVKLIKLEHH